MCKASTGAGQDRLALRCRIRLYRVKGAGKPAPAPGLRAAPPAPSSAGRRYDIGARYALGIRTSTGHFDRKHGSATTWHRRTAPYVIVGRGRKRRRPR
jgi:hypothetical protein